MSKQYLHQAYDLASAGHTQQLYNGWAQTYDEEISENGYASPRRTAQALAMSGANLDAPVLDIGCGTGVSGLFLRDAGFSELHGSDFSPEMLKIAEEKQIYKNIYNADLHQPFKFVSTVYPIIQQLQLLGCWHLGTQSQNSFRV